MSDHSQIKPPAHDPRLSPELAAKIELQIGSASIAIAQAVADMIDAIVCREVEKLRTECREEAISVRARLDRLEAAAEGRKLRVVPPFEVEQRTAGKP